MPKIWVNKKKGYIRNFYGEGAYGKVKYRKKYLLFGKKRVVKKGKVYRGF